MYASAKRYNMVDMPRPLAVIYVPGLGDTRIRGQKTAVNLWKLQGVESYLFQMNWMNGEQFQPKLTRLLALIDKLHSEDKSVALVAASAGGSAALNAFAARQEIIVGMVSICGKLDARGYGTVHPMLYRKNPAFMESMQMLGDSEAALNDSARARILSLHPIADEAVPVKETKLPGVLSQQMPVMGHFFGIAYGLTIGSRRLLRFLKDCSAKGPLQA